MALPGYPRANAPGSGPLLFPPPSAFTVTVVLIPPRAVKAATSVIRRGRSTLTRSSRMRLVTCFVINPLVAILLKIELEALQLDALRRRNVGESEGAEVRLARLRAHGRKLRTDDLDGIVPAGIRIVERLQDVAELVGHLQVPLLAPIIVAWEKAYEKGTGTIPAWPARPERPAVVLLSGGLDSATTAAIARQQGFALYALSVDYGQRHRFELEAARRVAQALGVRRHVETSVDLGQFGGSA